MKTVLFFAVPPLAGALIGFVTNVIAIKMLFRPLKEARLFGIRLPFTPGILPRQRRRLADSIGAMVERELLTPELIRQRLRREDVQAKASQSLAAFTSAMLAKPLDEFFDRRTLDRSVFDLLGLREPGEGLEHFTAAALREHAPFVMERIREETERLYPAALAGCIELLRRPETHRELEAHGWVFLNRAMRKLNMFQRFFLSAAQYDRTLDERMPEIIDDLINQIESLAAGSAIRQRVLGFAGGVLNRLLTGEDPALGRLAAGLLAACGNKPLGELLPSLGIAPGAPVGALFVISGEQKHKLDAWLCSRLLRIADEQIESALASINVRDMIADRINSLEMIRVERIILDVMASQLKWIDVFGAILGFTIGLFQVLCTWLFR